MLPLVGHRNVSSIVQSCPGDILVIFCPPASLSVPTNFPVICEHLKDWNIPIPYSHHLWANYWQILPPVVPSPSYVPDVSLSDRNFIGCCCLLMKPLGRFSGWCDTTEPLSYVPISFCGFKIITKSASEILCPRRIDLMLSNKLQNQRSIAV